VVYSEDPIVAVAPSPEAPAQEAEPPTETADPAPVDPRLEPMAIEEAIDAVTSADATTAFRAALTLAGDGAASSQAALRQALLRPPVIRLLSSVGFEDNRRMVPVGARSGLAKIFFALRDNGSDDARATIVALAQSRALDRLATELNDNPIDWLLLATASLRPPPAAVVRFWRAHARPDDGYTPLTIGALVQNGSGPALRLFGELLLGGAHGLDDRIGWIREEVPMNRHRPEILDFCADALGGRMPRPLKAAIIDSLFDYHYQWSHPDTHAGNPVEVVDMTGEAQIRYRGIAEQASAIPWLTEAQRVAVTRTLAALEVGFNTAP
jgi:hypothetical protein